MVFFLPGFDNTPDIPGLNFQKNSAWGNSRLHKFHRRHYQVMQSNFRPTNRPMVSIGIDRQTVEEGAAIAVQSPLIFNSKYLAPSCGL